MKWIQCKLRIGNMTLIAMHPKLPGQAPAPTVLDGIAQTLAAGRLADQRIDNLFTTLLQMVNDFDRPVDGRAFLIAGD